MRKHEAQRKFSYDQKVEMGERQEFCCGSCGRSFWRKPLGSLQAHHILPFSKNGATVIENGILLCPDCHRVADQEALIHGRIYGGDYTIADIQPEQKRNR